ncbi:hypothetical protein BGZ80_000211 [Entomortierella chlamydospora]|uniref:Phosphatidate phosphatase APP1 catalytic domain-containing protein n=1 Tax=Entomortierella chlamydospora TaxID=101097 RepID=A0A9P6MTP0_9FUNG|nr:hypothetical protein BGZ80_000211 [Entomortierella chlamydospora]
MAMHTFTSDNTRLEVDRTSVVRKIAGVTKDNKVYETLESRFGMFLNSNTQGAQFEVQCVGIASTTHMELAGDAESDAPIEEVLMDGPGSPDIETEVAQDIAHLKDSLKQGGEEFLRVLKSDSGSAVSHIQHATAALKSAATGHNSRVTDEQSLSQKNQEGHSSHIEQLHSPLLSGDEDDGDNHDHAYDYCCDGDHDNTEKGLSSDSADEEPKYPSDCEIPLSKLATPGSVSSWRILKSAFRRTKHLHVGESSYGSMDTCKHPKTFNRLKFDSVITELPRGMDRVESDASLLGQMTPEVKDLGDGALPTIRAFSLPGGHFNGTLTMTNREVEIFRKQAGIDEGGVIGSHPKFLKLHAHHQDMAEPAHGIVNLIEPEGVSIISDIDDTIKETNVTEGARTVLRNTFLKEMKEVEGMANVYRKWWEKGAAVHYVSNSPWQLIPTLLEFFHSHMFPPGSAHLKVYENNVLKSYFTPPGENKRRSIREILKDFPDRKFILVGDSGEIDMEIYTDIANEYPNQVFRIFIRDITTARLKDLASKAPPIRGRSFSALKAPISAVTTGFGFFSQRSSNSVTHFHEVMSPGSEDAIEVSSPYEMTEEESRKKDDSFSPKLEPSGPSSLAPETAASRSGSSTPTISPRLQAKQFSANVKNATVSLLSSALRRSSSNSSKRNGGRSPGLSPLASEIGADEHPNEYPFPGVGSPNTSSWISQHSGTNGTNSNISDDHEDSEDYGSHSPYLNESVSHLNLTEEMFEGQEQIIAKHKQSQHKQRPTRNNTFSFSSSSPSSFASPAGTPSVSKGNSPLHTPSMSPRILAQPTRGQAGGIVGVHGFSSTTTTLSSSISTGSATTTTTITTNSTTVLSSSPSLSTSSPGAGTNILGSPSSFSTIKSPLEVWRDRVIRCKRRLPKGVTLTLFESADELERCPIVQEMFTKFEDAGQLSASNSPTSVSTSESEVFDDLGSSVEFIDRCFDTQIEDRTCQVSA